MFDAISSKTLLSLVQWYDGMITVQIACRTRMHQFLYNNLHPYGDSNTPAFLSSRDLLNGEPQNLHNKDSQYNSRVKLLVQKLTANLVRFNIGK